MLDLYIHTMSSLHCYVITTNVTLYKKALQSEPHSVQNSDFRPHLNRPVTNAIIYSRDYVFQALSTIDLPHHGIRYDFFGF